MRAIAKDLRKFKVIARESLKGMLPWWARMGVRALMSHSPIDYRAWRSLALLRFGKMDQPEWAFEVFQRHLKASGFRGRKGFGVLELGPGDSLFSALIARALGAGHIELVDVGPFADADLAIYREMNAFLSARGFPAISFDPIESISDLLSAAGARYWTKGLESLRTIPDHSIDFVFSNTVLQHVVRSDLAETLSQLRRIVRDDGCCSHCVDLRDMMGHALNHLRFADSVWESRWVRRCGFYSNRLRYSEMIEAFHSAGFAVEEIEVNRWEDLPTPRRRLAKRFRDLPEDELRIATFHVILRPN